MAESLGAEIAGEYIDYVSGGSSDRPQFKKMLKDSFYGNFHVVLVWSLDRFSREGILQTMNYIETLKNHGVGLRSLQESWLDTTKSGMGELLLAIFSWVAEQERNRIRERTKEGHARAKRQGKHIGRPKGAKDKKKRSRYGYFKRYAKKRGG